MTGQCDNPDIEGHAAGQLLNSLQVPKSNSTQCKVLKSTDAFAQSRVSARTKFSMDLHDYDGGYSRLACVMIRWQLPVFSHS